MLAEADASVTGMALGSQQQEPNRIVVQFHKKTVQNVTKSTEAGRPIFEEKVYIRKIAPGGKNNIVDRPMREKDKMEFRKQWEAFEAGNTEEMAEGTPLSECPAISRSQAEELRFFKIFTVEQLIDAPDTVSMMGINMLKDKAKQFIALAEGKSVNEKMLEEELAERDKQMADMQAQLAELMNDKNAKSDTSQSDSVEPSEDTPTPSKRRKKAN